MYPILINVMYKGVEFRVSFFYNLKYFKRCQFLYPERTVTIFNDDLVIENVPMGILRIKGVANDTVAAS